MDNAPSAAFDSDIHERLLIGDPIAPADLVTAYLEPLTHGLQRHFSHVQDQHLIADAVTDTLLNYIENPTRFDPRKASLRQYLGMAARRDLLNALRKEQRRAGREQRTRQKMFADAVALRARSGNVVQEDEEPGGTTQTLMPQAFKAITDSRDQKCLQLILDGERKTAAYAVILEIQDYPVAEQRKIVKRHKDRLKKRLERLGAKLREQRA